MNASVAMAHNQVVNARERAKRREKLANAALGASSAAAGTDVSPRPAAPSAKGIHALKLISMKSIKVLHRTQS